MADPSSSSPTRPPRAAKRVPSGPRPPPIPHPASSSSQISPSSSRVTSTAPIPQSIRSHPELRGQPSIASLSRLRFESESPLDALIDSEHDFTISPEQSPLLPNESPSGLPGPSSPPILHGGHDPPHPVRGKTQFLTSPDRRDGKTSAIRSQTTPVPSRPSTPSAASLFDRPSTPSSFIIHRSSTPTLTSPKSASARPKPLRLQTANLVPPPSSSPTKAVSPSLKHWQQVRHHVLTTPAEERAAAAAFPSKGKKFGLVSKAAGRFGFRHAAENVMGYNDRRQSVTAMLGDLGGLSAEEKEEIARERRKFARDVKACLDACAGEESHRRLVRAAQRQDQSHAKAASIHGSQHTAQRYVFDPDFSAFAPLLTELHKHLPAARAKRAWSRTCPHHGAILAELSVAFLPGDTSPGNQLQVLEVFGTVVRNWAADNAEEELDRWIFLCRALRVDDRQLRTRGLTLLSSFMRNDPALPRGPDHPHTALDFQAVALALLELLHAVDDSSYDATDHIRAINELLTDLANGDILAVEEDSLVQVLSGVESGGSLGGSLGGVEKELLWLAAARLIGIDPSLAPWFLECDGRALKQFMPPPLLHATPPVVLNLRALSHTYVLSSLGNLIGSAEPDILRQIWDTISHLMGEIDHLPSSGPATDVQLARSLLLLELRLHDAEAPAEGVDPFHLASTNADLPREHRPLLEQLLRSERRKVGVLTAAKTVVVEAPWSAVTSMIKWFLENTAFATLGRECVPPIIDRISTTVSPSNQVRPFLAFLSTAHPQSLYKPLFSLSASTQSSSIPHHLRTVIALSDLLGPSRFWTHADPQMMVIVLMGGAAPKASKGKGKEGERGNVNVRLGRYAVLLELVKALGTIDGPAASGSRLRLFVDAIELRLGAMLEAEEKEDALPTWYRALICLLFLRLRTITMSLRRSPWQRLLLKWFKDPASQLSGQPSGYVEDPSTALSAVYNSIAKTPSSEPRSVTSPAPKMSALSFKSTLPTVPQRLEGLIDASLQHTLPSLLVAVHSCLSRDDWDVLTPDLWRSYASQGVVGNIKATTFLLMKCAELSPSRLRTLIYEDLQSPHVATRALCLEKLAKLYFYRYQVLAQTVLTDRRGPVFQWTSRTLDFVATEIGSPMWVASHDVQDAALQKFGKTLPLELRQRLMELGWSEDPSFAGENDAEQIPISSLPSLQHQEAHDEKGSSPSRAALTRRSSTGSAGSFSGRKRKAVFAPVLFGVGSEQAILLLKEANGVVGSNSLEVVRVFQRDDAAAFLRPLAEDLSTSYPTALARLNALATSAAPGFAYSALNALTGHLKLVLRSTPTFPGYSAALSTIAALVPSVSEISLRDIRKNKTEAMLLPASIHEDEGGFKLHGPWRDGLLDVQTAQLLLLNELLKANPREAYLVKKMLSNLQIQASIAHVPFARAWLVVVTTLFGYVNRNYNDRAELRHFLVNIAVILQQHGTSHLLIAAHAMRVFMLCAARFRRVFATMGFSTIMRSVYETYASGNAVVRDCIQYAARSFYRIHQDAFVYHTCVVIAEGAFDPAAVYDLLVSLSVPNSTSSGVPSGIRGLNDKEEIEAIAQMLSGPEISLVEIGTGRAERQAAKLASLDLDSNLFHRENIVRLFITVIAANPSTVRGSNFLRLFAGLVPQIRDPPSVELVREGVEALGGVILRGRVGDDAAMLVFHPDSGETGGDWTRARSGYVSLVESFAKAGGQLGASATKTTLEIVVDLLRKQPEAVGPAASGILRELAKTHLAGTKPINFLRDIAPLFRMFIAVVDFSGVLDSITLLIRQTSFELDEEMTKVIVIDYVGPAVRFLASASEEAMAFIMPLRSSIARLLASAVFLRGDAFGALERHPPNASLLASLVLPLTLLVEPPAEADRDAVYSALWIRLLHYVLQAARGQTAIRTATSSRANAAGSVLTLQIIKIIILRAPSAISHTRGLWSYLASHILNIVSEGDGRFFESGPIQPAPRVVDWMMWSLFELVCLHNSPLMIPLRLRIQTSLHAIQQAASRSRPSTPGGGARTSTSPQMISGRPRLSSVRSPSFAFHARSVSASASPEVMAHRRLPSSSSGLSPTPEQQGHVRMPSASGQSQFLSPLVGVGLARTPSNAARPSFADLSARRASRPVFDAFPSPSPGMRFRFPSSAPARALPIGEKGAGGGTIVHLLGAPSQVLSATSSAFPTLARRPSLAGEAIRELKVDNDELADGARRAIRVCSIMFGFEIDLDNQEDQDEPIKMWSLHDALHVISDQTRLFVEEEFRDVFNPTLDEEPDIHPSQHVDKALEAGYTLDQTSPFDEEKAAMQIPVQGTGALQLEVPRLSVTPS